MQAQYEDSQALLALDDAAGDVFRVARVICRVTNAADSFGAGSRLHHTTPDLGLSSETQSDSGIDVEDLPPQVQAMG